LIAEAQEVGQPIRSAHLFQDPIGTALQGQMQVRTKPVRVFRHQTEQLRPHFHGFDARQANPELARHFENLFDQWGQALPGCRQVHAILAQMDACQHNFSIPGGHEPMDFFEHFFLRSAPQDRSN
jgi:hypothetical protein